jgi:hypothetical protein
LSDGQRALLHCLIGKQQAGSSSVSYQ